MSAKAPSDAFRTHFGEPCLPAELLSFREALWAASSALSRFKAEQGQHTLNAGGIVKYEVMDVFYKAYSPKAREDERFSALWRAMKMFELLQEATADPSRAAGLLNPAMGSDLVMVDMRILGAVAALPLRLGESITWEMVRKDCGLSDS